MYIPLNTFRPQQNAILQMTFWKLFSWMQIANCEMLDLNLTKVYVEGYNWSYVNIGSGNDYALNRQHALLCQLWSAFCEHLEKYFRYKDVWLYTITICNSVTFLAATKQLYKWYFPSVRLSVRLSVCLSLLLDYVPIIVSSWNFQELLPMTKVRSMQKVKVRGQRSRSQRSQPNLTVSGL